MIQATRSNLSTAKVQTIHIGAWTEGVITAQDVPRTPRQGLSSVYNCILRQNGTIQERPSLVRYGAQPTGTVLGTIGEFRDTTVVPNVNYRIMVQKVGSTAKVYYSKDFGDWVAAAGSTTYNTTARCHFKQIDNVVLVTNGVDTLTQLDIPTKTIVPFTALAAPATPTLTTNTGLTGTTFTTTYRVTANSATGETIASAVLSVPVSTDRDFWNKVTPGTQSLKIGWTAVTGAVSYNVYMGTGGAGTEFRIARALTGLTYTDDGSAYQDNTSPYPLVDSTAGPKATRADVVNNIVYLTGIADDPYSVIAGGTYPYQLDFSPAHGGDKIPINFGGKELPVRVSLFRNNTGASSIKVYCSGTNGKGKRFSLTPDSITVANQTVNFYDVSEDAGEDGTNAPDTLTYYEDSNYYLSTDGVKTDGTLPQIQNIISTRRVSNTIQDAIPTLNSEAVANACALGWEGRLYFAVPSNSLTNNQIWVNEIDRGGGWMKPWDIAADWMMLYNSNPVAAGGDGKTHFTVLQNNIIYEFSTSVHSTDDGTSFSSGGNSGQIFFSEDKRVCAKLLNVIFTFLRVQGTVNVGVSGQFKKNNIRATNKLVIDAGSTAVGWSEAPLGWSSRGWSEVVSEPVVITSASVEVKVKVNKEVRWFDYNWNSQLAGTDYQLSDVVAEFVVTGIRDL